MGIVSKTDYGSCLCAVLGMVSRDDIYQLIETISASSEEDTALSGTPVCIINSKSISYVKDTRSRTQQKHI
jgi:hypothetical protein